MSSATRRDNGAQASLFAVKPSERQLKPFPVSEWVAMSVLQKAIRRGEQEIALRAAATLLELKPDRLWRRLSGICYEDIGLTDVETVEAIIKTIGASSRRRHYGNDAEAAEAFVLSMCNARKSRAADDLLIAVNNHPDLELARLTIATEVSERRLERIATYGSLLGRAMAITTIMHQNRYGLNGRKIAYVSPKKLFSALAASGVDCNVISICRHGHSRTGEVLPILVALLSQYDVQSDETKPYRDDEGMETNKALMASGVPLWSYDQFSREGMSALDVFLKSGAETAKMLIDVGSHHRRRKVLGGLLFRVESQLVRQRQQSIIGHKLKELADNGFTGLPTTTVRELTVAMHKDLPVLDGIRRQLFDGNPVSD